MGTPTGRRRRVRVALAIPVLAAVLLTNAACSQPKLERLARDLQRSIPREGDGTVSGLIVMGLSSIEVKGADTASLGNLVQVPQVAVAAARFVVQPGRDRAALVGPKGVVGLTDQRILYARRELNGPADKRPWARLELERLSDIDVPRLEVLREQTNAGSLAVLSPEFALDLLSGVLTGSVKSTTLEDGGKSVRFNTSIDKANRELDLSEDERDDRERLLRSLAVTGDIFKGVAQLRADGTLRALRLEINEKPDRLTTAKVIVELDMEKGPENVRLTPPARNETVRVSSLSALRSNLVQQLSPEAAAGLPAGLATGIPSA